MSIGSTTFIDIPYLEIGDDSKINEQVFVGGLQYHNSKFVLGKNCQVMQMSFINPAKSIVIGDDTGIGGHCLLFGHASWQSEFEGYPVDFDDLGYPVGFADDYVRCTDLHDPNAFAVRVVGDSMEPKFAEGDIVIFSPAVDISSGDDCFVRFTMPHEATFKRVFFEEAGSVRLQPRNEKYPPKVIDGKRVNGLYRAVMRLEKL